MNVFVVHSYIQAAACCFINLMHGCIFNDLHKLLLVLWPRPQTTSCLTCSMSITVLLNFPFLQYHSYFIIVFCHVCLLFQEESQPTMEVQETSTLMSAWILVPLEMIMPMMWWPGLSGLNVMATKQYLFSHLALYTWHFFDCICLCAVFFKLYL